MAGVANLAVSSMDAPWLTDARLELFTHSTATSTGNLLSDLFPASYCINQKSSLRANLRERLCCMKLWYNFGTCFKN